MICIDTSIYLLGTPVSQIKKDMLSVCAMYLFLSFTDQGLTDLLSLAVELASLTD